MTKHLVSGLYFILLSLCCVFFLRGISTFYPLDYWDESFYLLLGTKFPSLTTIDWAPFYRLFYKFLYLFQPDTIHLYYENFAIQVSAIPLLHYALSRRLGVSALFSFVGGFFVLISTVNAPIAVKLNHFNLICFYSLILMTSFFRSELRALFCLAMGCLALIYVRQDNLVIAVLCMAYLIFRISRQSWPSPRKLKTISGAVISFAALTCILIAAIGSPFTAERSWNAFADHFYWNKMPHLNSSVTISRNALIEQTFGSAHSIGQAFLANPKAFLGHSKSNVFWLVENFPARFTTHFPLLRATPDTFESASQLESSILSSLVSILVVCYLIRHGTKGVRKSEHAFLFRIFSFFVLFCFIRTLIDISIFNVVPRYTFEFMFSLALLIFASVDFVSGEKKNVFYLSIPIFLLVFCPNHRDASFYPIVGEAYNSSLDPIKKVSLFLKGESFKSGKKGFCNPGYAAYSLEREEFLSPFDFMGNRAQYRDLADFLTRKESNLVILDSELTYVLERLGRKDDVRSLREFIETQKMRKIFDVPNKIEIWRK